MVRAMIDVLFALAALVAILDYFGIKPKQPIWGLAMPLSKNWKLLLMLGLVGLSLALSGYGYYRSSRPKIVEKIVDRPVERIVEKLVPQECPKPAECPKPKSQQPRASENPAVVIPPNSKIEATTMSPDSAAVGVNTGTVTVNPPVNPYRPVVTYDFNGVRRESSPGQMLADSSAVADFQKLKNVYDKKDWKTLAEMSEEQIKLRPEWLTPYLLAGIAYANLGNKQAAIKNLEFVSDKSAGIKEYSDADRILKLLKQP
jgi:hypothetical protein